jgi:hypothetical protein
MTASSPNYQLSHTYLTNPVITVNGITYTQVSGTPSTTASLHQYSLDYATGQVTFGVAPNVGDTVSASYNYSVNSGNQAGIFVQMASAVNNLTEVGGNIDTISGSNGSLTRQMTTNNKQIAQLQANIQLEQQMLYNEYNTMQTQLMQLQSQSSYFSSMMSGSSSSSSSSK